MQTAALHFIEAALSTFEGSLHDRDAGFRNVQLATASQAGPPGLRTLVLRGFERLPARAEMHTDARAAKVGDIAHAAEVALLAWSSAEQLQLRFEGSARLHRDDDIARARWDRLSPNARDTYGLRAIPGTPIDAPGDVSHLPAGEQFRQFTVILVSLASVDILRLGPDGGQTRARARFTPAGIVAHWIAP